MSPLFAAPVAANHMQMDSGRVIVFDHVGGNENWVEVQLAGQDGGQVSSLLATSYDAAYASGHATWYPMAWHADWGKWTAGFHIQPGSPVKFRAMWAGGAMQDSCWFSHPDGAESCGGDPNPTPFEPTFSLVKGNEWWVQTAVSPNDGHTVDHVEVHVGAGDWMPLARQSWGVREYAGNYHIPDGSVLQFRATDTSTLSALSPCYKWLPPPDTGNGAEATAIPCGGTVFAANWTALGGNAWWIEGVVHANAPVRGVDVTINCQGPAYAMTYHGDWGKWALGGTRIPSGARVTLRVQGETGVASSSYVWPQATAAQPC